MHGSMNERSCHLLICLFECRIGIDSAVQIIVYVASRYIAYIHAYIHIYVYTYVLCNSYIHTFDHYRDYVYQIAPYFKTLNTVIALKANGDI